MTPAAGSAVRPDPCADLRKTAQGKKAPSQRPKIPFDNQKCVLPSISCDGAPGRHFFKEQIEGRAWVCHLRIADKIIISERRWRWQEAPTLDALRCNLSRAPPSSRRPNVLLGRWHQTREPSSSADVQIARKARCSWPSPAI
jgi:hypothetical protein